ncbi:MAG: serine/threonine-protein phosphatase [Kiritimatiellae bacterium]|nr:serine/threonine-protein phosphatase [Kiritimatiellia bacterium]
MTGLCAWLAARFGRGGEAAAQGPLRFDVAAASDRGLVRPENEDSYLMRPDDFFLAVADGMGGGADGALASAWISEAFKELLADPPAGFRRRVKGVGAALDAANARIRAYMKERGIKMMGSTAAALLADPARPARAVIAHVGDSRIYRWRRGKGSLLTRDHTVGDELGRAHVSDSEAAALKSRKNPLSHILTRAVGTGFKVRPDWRKIDLRAGDRYLLCTDGVHDVLSDEQVSALLGRAKTPAEAVKAFARDVIARGAPDNYTLVCAFVKKGG